MATVFEISGPLAFYRKPYTTTSSTSFPLPPPTAIAGLLAGILGISNGCNEEAIASNYWNYLSHTRIAIQRLNFGAWYSTTINFRNTKDPQKNIHLRIKHQFVKNPHYRIFVQGGIEEDLNSRLVSRKFHYTPTLGTAYALAEIVYCGSFDFDSHLISNEEEIEIQSAIPVSENADMTINFIKTQGLMKDSFPFCMDSKRTILETIHLLYPSNPNKGIFLTPWEGLDVTFYDDHTYIAWLPAWR